MHSVLSARASLWCLLPLFTLVGCSSQTARHHEPAPVVVPGKSTQQANANAAPPSVAVAPAVTLAKPVQPTLPPQLSVQPTLPPAETIVEPSATVSNLAAPVSETVVDTNKLESIKQQQAKLRKVVVLLPDHPSLTEVNQEIEKGIRLAHEQQPHHAALQLIFIHDSLPPDQLMQKAQAYAPDWIIGPLTKQDIQGMQAALMSNQIVLNRLEQPTAALQFGLPVEDEASQLVSQLKLRQPIAVAYSQDATEQRLASSVEQEAALRNMPVLSIVLDKHAPSLQDWLNAEGGLMASKQRIEQVTRLLHQPVNASVQPRRDIQALVLLSGRKQAHQYMPSVQYLQLQWPMLATSRFLPSQQGERFNEPDFERVRVLTPPYLLQENGPKTAFQALGWDSYRLLANPTAYQVQGMTGKLSVNGQNQVVRQLSWKRIQQSQLVELK